ncbi:MAG: hypothetical protein QG602_2986, partial [Verrucomicrobiota bacterium]|nr:hypothetical protein [Verrucomicrobiota bacterium]
TSPPGYVPLASDLLILVESEGPEGEERRRFEQEIAMGGEKTPPGSGIHHPDADLKQQAGEGDRPAGQQESWQHFQAGRFRHRREVKGVEEKTARADRARDCRIRLFLGAV